MQVDMFGTLNNPELFWLACSFVQAFRFFNRRVKIIGAGDEELPPKMYESTNHTNQHEQKRFG